MMNTGRLLTKGQRQQIDVISYGSATMIPKGYFGNAENNISRLDVIAMTNPLAYGLGLMGKQYDMHLLAPSTHNPLKEHGLLGATYAEEIKRRGYEFKQKYFGG